MTRELPLPPAWHDAAHAATREEWITRHFVAAEAVPGYVLCLKCASLVLDGHALRHWDALHGFKGF